MHHPITRHVAVNITGMALTIACILAGAALGLVLNGGGPQPSQATYPTASSSGDPRESTRPSVGRLTTKTTGPLLRSRPGSGGNTKR